MGSKAIAQLVQTAGLGALCFGALTAPAAAGTFHQGWYYSVDARGDGAGGEVYDITGLAIRPGNTWLISLTGNMPLTGNPAEGPEDGNVGWGDLFINTTGLTFQAASDAAALTAIRFAGTNDSGVPTVGVYTGVSAASVTAINSGFDSLSSYYAAGWYQEPTLGDLVTAEEAYAYLGSNTLPLNVIGTGTYQGGLTLLDDAAAAAAGLDFARLGAAGQTTITFEVAADAMPVGGGLFSVLLECANDAIALIYTAPEPTASESVPEPGILSGLALLAAAGGFKLRQQS